MYVNRDRCKDSLMNTVAFSDGMGEIYSDIDHLDKCLKSVNSDEIDSQNSEVVTF